jgi:hypothetical protein
VNNSRSRLRTRVSPNVGVAVATQAGGPGAGEGTMKADQSRRKTDAKARRVAYGPREPATSNYAEPVKAQLLQHLTFSMPCAEAVRLKGKYYIALMRWSKTLFAPQLGLKNESAVEAELARLAAFEARNEAASVLATHQQGCAVCRSSPV